MDLQHPMSSVIPGPRGVILELLANTFEPLTGNQIAKLSGGRASQSTVSRELAGLVASGLVSSRPAGSARLYELNREHVGAGAVMAAASMRDVLLERLEREVRGWEREAVAVWMFGSAARGSGTQRSDIDVLVVRPHDVDREDPIWNGQLLELARSVTAWTGNDCEILEYTVDELAGLADSGDRLIGELRRDALPLVGERPSVLLRRARAN